MLPSGDDVLMQVLRYTGPGNLPLIHTDVEPLRLGDFAQNLHSPLRQLGHFTGLFFCGLIVVSHVTIGADQKVAGIVGKQIQQDKAGFTAKDNQAVLVGAFGC